ncbi:hypothetical protein pb186bvf_007652 [Paramecium bursaria]
MKKVLFQFSRIPKKMFDNSKDYYQILGVPRDSTSERISVVYFQLSQKFRPGGQQQDKQKHLEVIEAYGILSDNIQRRLYDEQLQPVYEEKKEVQYNDTQQLSTEEDLSIEIKVTGQGKEHKFYHNSKGSNITSQQAEKAILDFLTDFKYHKGVKEMDDQDKQEKQEKKKLTKEDYIEGFFALVLIIARFIGKKK